MLGLIGLSPARSNCAACWRAVILGLLFTWLQACSIAPTSVAPEEAIASATGVADAVRFEVTGGALDVEGPDGATLTLADAVRLALQADPALQESLSRVRVAIAEADQARLLPNPILNIILKFPAGGGSPNIEAGITEDLIGVLKQPRRASAADQRLRAASAEAVTTALDVVAEVREAYVAVQALSELVPVLDERRRIVSKLLQLARDRLEAGEGTRSDVTTLDAQRVDLEVEIAERQQEQQDARLRLTHLLGRPTGQATWSLEGWQAPAPIASKESAWIAAALVNRPEVQVATWELAARGDDRALAAFAAFESAEVGVKGDRDGEWTVGPDVTLPLPLFDFGGAQRAKAEAELIEARHVLTKARRQVVEDVRRAFESLTASRANLDRVTRELIPLQQQRRAEAEDAYKLGLADVTTLLLAEQDLQASLAKRVQLEQDSALTLVRLERAVGGAGIATAISATPQGGNQGNEPGVVDPSP